MEKKVSHEEINIYNLLGMAEDYILKNIRWRSEIIGTERTEIPEIPVAVIREVLANSFAHAVYNGRTNHEICIHPGMITIYSPGEYASNHKPEDYMKGNYESVIRDATIAKILYLNKSIEQFGGARVAGPILLGFNKPVSDLSRGSTIDDIILTTECLIKLI